jgi:hypothetical protein
MWTVDSRCSQCGHKETCEDRKIIIPDLVTMSNTLNTNQANLDGTGDGIFIMACNDFTVK